MMNFLQCSPIVGGGNDISHLASFTGGFPEMVSYCTVLHAETALEMLI